MADGQDFSGLWHSKYTYHNDLETEGVSEHDVKMYKTGSQLVLQSIPNDEGSYLIARLTVDDNILTGTWEEQTSPTGKYKGQRYYGAGQLLIDASGDKITGKIVNQNHALEIITGDWELTRSNKAA